MWMRYTCIHDFSCMWARMGALVGMYVYMWRPGANVRNHPQSLFHIVLWYRVFQSKSELTKMASCISQLAIRSPISAFQDWSYRWATMSPWHLHGLLDYELTSSCLYIKGLNCWVISLAPDFRILNSKQVVISFTNNLVSKDPLDPLSNTSGFAA